MKIYMLEDKALCDICGGITKKVTFENPGDIVQLASPTLTVDNILGQLDYTSMSEAAQDLQGQNSRVATIVFS